jgi:DNA polymerase III subunit delta'
VAVTRLLNDFVGQDQALNLLRNAVKNPVHAYVLYGPPGCGVVPASREFAASLVCEQGGCGECPDCLKAMRGIHPDVIVAMAEGPTYGVDYVKYSLGVWAMRQPLEAKRTVMVIPDADGIRADVTGAFLKMIEEPVASTIFVLLATTLPKQHITIWSRCAEIPFRLLSVDEVAQVLVNDGVNEEQARMLAEGAGGDVSRARLFGGLYLSDSMARVPRSYSLWLKSKPCWKRSSSHSKSNMLKKLRNLKSRRR